MTLRSRRDDDAFAAFVAGRSAALHGAAYLMVGDRTLAQDLVQEALAKTYAALPRLRDQNAVEAYTRKAITTTAISWFRRKSWHGEVPTETLPERAAEATQDHVAVKDWLWQGLGTLPPRQRAAVVLRYYDDLTEAQTAAALGCTVGTVKSQVSAALKNLRTQLGPDLQDLDQLFAPSTAMTGKVATP